MAGLGRVYTLDEIRDKTVPTLKKHGVHSALLFGSYAKGTANAQSDLDILISSDLQGFAFFELLADLFDIFGENTVDLYDVRELIPGTDFAHEVLATGVELC